MTRSLVGKALLTTALTSLAASMAMAQAVPLHDADLVEPLNDQHHSTNNAYISGDGSTVWATSNRSGYTPFIVRWTPEGGTEWVGGPTGIWHSGYIQDVNEDGSVVVAALYANGRNGAWRWSEETGWEDIGGLPGALSAYAYGVNADGTVVVGQSSSTLTSAFRWVEGEGMENLGHLGGWYAYASDVNDAGDVVVGYSTLSSGLGHAFRWVEGEGMSDLGTLVGGANSNAHGVNADGTVVVGWSQVEVPVQAATDGTGPVTQNHAFRWVEGEGMHDLGTIGRYQGSSGEDVNADGSVVVGIVDTDSGSRAFRWVEGEGLTNLGTLVGGTWSYAFSVSDDGNIVVG